MDAKNVVNVQIFGHSYTIRGEADQEYILGVAAYVDRKMREITEKLPVASLSKGAILASLNIADEVCTERAQQEAQGLDEDGLARAGLSGERAESRLERDFRGFDDREIADAQAAQHPSAPPT